MVLVLYGVYGYIHVGSQISNSSTRHLFIGNPFAKHRQSTIPCEFLLVNRHSSVTFSFELWLKEAFPVNTAACLFFSVELETGKLLEGSRQGLPLVSQTTTLCRTSLALCCLCYFLLELSRQDLLVASKRWTGGREKEGERNRRKLTYYFRKKTCDSIVLCWFCNLVVLHHTLLIFKVL